MKKDGSGTHRSRGYLDDPSGKISVRHRDSDMLRLQSYSLEALLSRIDGGSEEAKRDRMLGWEKATREGRGGLLAASAVVFIDLSPCR